MKGKLLFCLIILFSLSANCICAQTKDDVSLFEIDRLIRRTEYDEALRLLNVYIKNKLAAEIYSTVSFCFYFVSFAGIGP